MRSPRQRDAGGDFLPRGPPAVMMPDRLSARGAPMKIAKLETFLANAGLRNYLFLRLTTDTGLTGLGEASLEWQEKAVETLIHEWVEERVLGTDPFDVESLGAGLIRDQYQGGPTVLTAI